MTGGHPKAAQRSGVTDQLPQLPTSSLGDILPSAACNHDVDTERFNRYLDPADGIGLSPLESPSATARVKSARRFRRYSGHTLIGVDVGVGPSVSQ